MPRGSLPPWLETNEQQAFSRDARIGFAFIGGQLSAKLDPFLLFRIVVCHPPVTHVAGG